MILNLLKYAKKYKWFAMLSPLCILVEVLIEVFIPMMMSLIVDVGINGGSLEGKNAVAVRLISLFGLHEKTGIAFVLGVGGIMVVLAILSLLAGAAAARFAATAGVGFGAELRRGVFDRVQDFGFANIDRFSTGSLVTRLTTDINVIQNTFMMAVRMFVRAPFMFVMAITMAVSINKKLALIFLIVAPLIGVMMIAIGARAFPRFERMFKKYDRINTAIQENLIGIRVVKAFVRAKHEKEKFAATNDDLRDASVFAEKLVVINEPLMTLAIYSCIIMILWFGGHIVTAGGMQIGELISFITYVQQILMALMMISMIFVMTIMSRASMRRVTAVLTERPDITDEGADPGLAVPDGSVEFRNVCFKYDKNGEKNVLDSIDLKIASGETIGVIGPTGSAKTTLVSLIPRLYDITSGELLVGGRDVKDYTVENLRESVSMVLQNNVLFSGTIAENLRWGNGDATDEEVARAAKLAQADEFIRSFPDGYETNLGQGGVNVSGGQKQRLCIARALLKKPKILILDDSTSAVDTATDRKIREGFRSLMGDTTVIIIAQRLNSVMDADRIIVLDDGRVDGVGTHEELLATNRIYSEVWNSQQEGAENDG